MQRLYLSFVVFISLFVAKSYADYTATVGAGTNFGSALVTTVHYAKMLICDLTAPATQCATVSAAGAVKVDNSAVTQPVSQATAANLNATVVNGGTFATQLTGATNNINTVTNLAQMNGAALLMGNGVTGTGSQRVTIASDNTAFAVNATLSAETTKVIGTTRTLGNGGAIVDFAGQNATSPANSWLTGGQFNTTPTTLTTGNASPLQLDNAANLLTNVKVSALPTGAATSALQGTNTNTTAHTCSVAGYSILGCLGQIDDDVKSPIALGTAGGWTPLKLAALSNTPVAIKASSGWLGKLYCYNPNATVAYIQVYNVASGSVTVGTTAALQSYGIPATSGAGFVMNGIGDQYGTAISAAATTTAGGGTAPGTAMDCNVSFN